MYPISLRRSNDLLLHLHQLDRIRRRKREKESNDTKTCPDSIARKIYLETGGTKNLIFIEDRGLARLRVAGARAQDLVILRHSRRS